MEMDQPGVRQEGNIKILIMARFIIQRSDQVSDGWVCTDTENGIVCTFEGHKFNDTQKITFLNDMTDPDPLCVARQMREMGDWLFEHHYEKIF